jgi:hypothetical protein
MHVTLPLSFRGSVALALCVSGTVHTHGQDFLASWVATFPGHYSTSSSTCYRVTTDADSNTFAVVTGTGYDPDPGPGELYSGSVNIVKLNAAHALVGIWESAQASIANMVSTPDGELYITGRITGTGAIDFDPGADVTMLEPGFSIYIAKLTNDLQLLWVKQFLMADAQCNRMPDDEIGITEPARALTVLPNGNVAFVANWCVPAMDFDPGPATYAPFSDANTANGGFLLMLNPDGELQWVRPIEDVAHSAVACDAHSNVYVSATILNQAGYTMYFDLNDSTHTGIMPADGYTAVLVSYDANGNYRWHDWFPSWLNMGKISVAEGFVYVATGYVMAGADFDPGPGVVGVSQAGYGVSSAHVVKLDTMGGFHAVWPFLSAGGTTALDLLPIDGRLLVAGWYFGVTDLDPSAGTELVSGPQIHGFLAEVGTNGALGMLKLLSAPTQASEVTQLNYRGDVLRAVGSFRGNCYFSTTSTGSYPFDFNNGFLVEIPYTPLSTHLPDADPPTTHTIALIDGSQGLELPWLNGSAPAIRIHDQLGRAVLAVWHPSEQHLDVSGLAPGLYHLQTSGPGASHRMSFVVAR